jgi:hypothetical protein
MRNTNTMTVRGPDDVLFVFDHIEAGKYQSVDFVEAYLCPDGCVSGQLTIEGRHAAQRNIQHIVRQVGRQRPVDEEKVRAMVRDDFFDVEEQITARGVRPLAADLRTAIARRQEEEAIRARLPQRDCAACGAPNCATLAQDVVRGAAREDDCVFVKLEQLARELQALKEGHA